MKFKKSHILLISLISLFLLMSMSAVSAASDDASIAQAMEMDDIDGIDDMGTDINIIEDNILSVDDDPNTGGEDNTNPDDPGTGGNDNTDPEEPLPVSETTIESGDKTYTFGSNITFDVVVKDNQSAVIENLGQDNFEVYYKNSTDEAFKEIDFTFSDSQIKLDFDTNKTLPFDNYTIKIVFLNSVIGGVNYTENETTLNLTITKTNTTLDATDVNYKIGDDIIIPISMNVESGKTLNFDVKNMNVTLIVEDGENQTIAFEKVAGGIKLLNLTDVDTYQIFINYIGNKNCNSSNDTVTVVIEKTNSTIDANDINIIKGEELIIPLVVRMESNKAVNLTNETLEVYLVADGENNPINFTIVNGGVKLLNLTQEFGKYNIYIKYLGEENRINPSEKTIVLAIVENNTINADDTIYVNNHTKNVTIPINITNAVVTPSTEEDGEDTITVTPLNLTKDNITLVLKYFNGEENVTEIVTDFNLIGENGNYTINFITDHFDDSELTIIYANGSLNETKKTVSLKWSIDVIVVPEINSADFQQGEFIFKVYDAYDNTALTNLTITVNVKGMSFITINGTSITIGPRDFTTDEDGKITINNTNDFSIGGSILQGFLPADIYNVTFKGKEHYLLNDTKEITINKVQAEIIASPLVDEYGKILTYTFQVINSVTREAIQSAKVQFRIYSNNIDATRNGTTNSTGFYTSPDLNLIAGTYNLDLKSLDSSLICSAVKQTITLNQRTAVISASDRTVLYGSGDYVVATVKDKKTGKLLPNVYVLIQVYTSSKKATNYLTITDSKGVARLNTGLSVGKTKVVISVLDNNYKSGSLTRYVTVKKTTGKFSAPKVSTYYKSGKVYKVKLTNTKNNALMNGAKVNIKVFITKNKYYNLTGTTSKGLVQFKITFKPGTYKVVVSSADKGYTAKSVTSQIKVSKSPIKMAPTALTVKRYKYFKVKVTSTKSKKVLSGVKVKVKVYTGKKYKTYTIKTNKKGIASLKISQKVGKHKVVLTPAQTKYYTGKTVTKTLKVTK